MKPAPFQYTRPETVADALTLLERYSADGKVIAGGQSLVPMMNFRMAQPSTLIDINRLTELDYHHCVGQQLRVGALVRHVTLRESLVVREACPLISDAYKFVAHATVRNRGTLCGSICHADPAAEMPAVMLALDATMVLSSSTGQREIAAKDFFQGIYATEVASHELLTEVRIPRMGPRVGYGFKEFSVRRGDFAIVLTATLLDVRDDVVVSARIVYAGVSDRPVRREDVEAILIGQQPTEALFKEAGKFAAASMEVGEDVHADSDYRLGLVQTLTHRALRQAHIRACTDRPHRD